MAGLGASRVLRLRRPGDERAARQRRRDREGRSGDRAARRRTATRAATAVNQAHAAQGQANKARDELHAAQKQGRDADRAYHDEAGAITGQIAAAASEIRAIPRLPGGAPVPITITAADINLAHRMLHRAGNLAGAAKAAANPALLRRLARGPLTPAAAAAFLLQLQIADENAPKAQQGSIWDGLGGIVNILTFGAVSFGNPNTARYRGGELAAMLPIDPEALIVDGEKGLVKLTREASAGGLALAGTAKKVYVNSRGEVTNGEFTIALLWTFIPRVRRPPTRASSCLGSMPARQSYKRQARQRRRACS